MRQAGRDEGGGGGGGVMEWGGRSGEVIEGGLDTAAARSGRLRASRRQDVTSPLPLPRSNPAEGFLFGAQFGEGRLT